MIMIMRDDRFVLAVAAVVSFLPVASAFWLQRLVVNVLFPQQQQRIAGTPSYCYLR